MKCCNNIENLGCFDSCKSIVKTGLIADSVGIWLMEIDYMGITKRTEFEVYGGTPLAYPLAMPLGAIAINKPIEITNDLNEDYEYILRIYRPNGTLFNNTCYSFKIYKVICN